MQVIFHFALLCMVISQNYCPSPTLTLISNHHWRAIQKAGCLVQLAHRHLSSDMNQNKSCILNFRAKSSLKTVALFPLQMLYSGGMFCPRQLGGVQWAIQGYTARSQLTGSSSTAAAPALSAAPAVPVLPCALLIVVSEPVVVAHRSLSLYLKKCDPGKVALCRRLIWLAWKR